MILDLKILIAALCLFCLTVLQVESLPFRIVSTTGQALQPDQYYPGQGTWLRAQDGCNHCYWYSYNNHFLLSGYYGSYAMDASCTDCSVFSSTCNSNGGHYILYAYGDNNANQKFAIFNDPYNNYWNMIVPNSGASYCGLDSGGSYGQPAIQWNRLNNFGNSNQLWHLDYLSCSAGTYWDGSDEHAWCNTCPAGAYCPGGSSYYSWCSPGSYSSSTGASSCQSCPAGTYTYWWGSLSCSGCPAGQYCPIGTSYPSICPVGMYCPGNSAYPYYCPSGTYAPYQGYASCSACTAGTYQPWWGASYCYGCPAGSYCSGGTVWPVSCPVGQISTGNAGACSVCPAGTYLPITDTARTQCYGCGAGTYSSSAASTSCSACPSGSYSAGTDIAGGVYANYCPLCQATVAGVSPTTAVSYYHWVGGPLISQCVCDAGWTGSNCEISKCPDSLAGGSLGSLLLNSDAKLNQYSRNISMWDPLDVEMYLIDFIRVGIDVNGDGNITRLEMMTALGNRQIFSAGMTSLKVWCQSAQVGAYCYENFGDQVQVVDMYKDAVYNFFYSPYNMFDGSGIGTLTNIQSTYPNPIWNVSTCQAYDHSIYNKSFITTTWNIVSNPPIKRVCGYVNGLLNSDFTTTAVLSGAQTSFQDKAVSGPTIQNKRIYCVAVEYCAPGSEVIGSVCYGTCPAPWVATGTKCVLGLLSQGRPVTQTTVSYECSVGLIYDGAPVDLTPKLTHNGVTFAFMDTSTSEKNFDIFAGELGSLPSDKTHVVSIPIGLVGCGRVTNPISFTDQINSMSVGQIIEYGITATQKYGNLSLANYDSTEMTVFPYRIPFLVIITGSVVFQSGYGVEGVKVDFCHIDKHSKLPDSNPNFCPLISLTTDKFGAFSGEIRVSDYRWINQVEYFTVTPSYDQLMSDGTIVTHTFAPMDILGLSHALGVSNIKITDTTQTRIYGSTMFANVAPYNCPLPGVPIELTRDNGEKITTTSASDGTFDFTVTLGEAVKVRIPSFNGHSWSSSYGPIQLAGRRRLEVFSSGVPSNTTSLTPTKTPTSVPTLTPTSVPSSTPTTVPSTTPSAIPTVKPTASPTSVPSKYPTSVPTSKPSAPTVEPTTEPTSAPTETPTATPTLHAYSTSAPELIHRFTFDDYSMTNNKLIPDIMNDGEFAYMQNGLTILDGSAIFTPSVNPKAQPFLQLGAGIFNDADSVTIEIWASFDSKTKDNAVIYSFGDEYNKISLNAAGFAGQSSVYIVVVINPPAGYVSTFVNGTLSETHSYPKTPFLQGAGGSEAFNYIGWDRKKTTPGLSAVIDEVRIWAGVLGNYTITQNNITGHDPTFIQLTSADTRQNTQINYLVTSRVNATVGFYGGLTKSPMFGPETQFTVSALDPQCGWSTTLTLNAATSFAWQMVAAMNYTFELVPYATPLPTPAYKTKSCAPSLDPYSFLSTADQLSQDLHVDLLVSKKLPATFIYRSGLCIDILGAENFATSTPPADQNGLVCYANTTTILNQGQNLSLTMKLYELYPKGNGWIITPKSLIDPLGAVAVKDYFIPDSMIEVSDVVSGHNSAIDFVYSPKTYNDSTLSLADVPAPLNYTITAGVPRPSVPFALPFNVYAKRNGPEGVSQFLYSSFVPIIGALPSEVPDVYPVTTDPTLIFMVLRDPPGGNSFTTIQAGTTFGVAVEIDGMRTFEKSAYGDLEGGFAYDGEVKGMLAPLGIGTSATLFKGTGKATGKGTMQGPFATATRLSTSHYEYSFNFEYDFSTSSDPFIAGHASDVIIGGGVDIIVSKALEVYQNRTTATSRCLGFKVTPTWHPGAVTTYMLPVIEIEILVDKLTELIQITAPTDSSTAAKLTTEKNNWITVLTTYRSYNTDLTQMFSADTQMFINIMSEFQQFQSGQLSADDFAASLDRGSSYDSEAFADGGVNMITNYVKNLNSAYSDVSGTCDQLLGQGRGVVLDAICNDFNDATWNTFSTMVTGACDIPLSGTSSNPLSNSVLFQSMCKHGKAPDSNLVPGGLASGGDVSLFSFLRDNTKLVTYSANAPMQLSWTSTVTDQKAFQVNYEVTKTLSGEFATENQLLGPAGLGAMLNAHIGGDRSFTLNLGKSSDSSHTADRTVTINLDDADSGDYFAVRITEDPIYATPMFTTMGGASKCPGETGTSRRESRVTIKQVRPRCGATKNLPCTPDNLAAGDVAVFGVVIENLSPTEDEVYYTLQFSTKYDDFNTAGAGPSYVCGAPGQQSGLQVTFANTDLQRIPYNRWIEVPFAVSQSAIPLCHSFANIEVQIIATCEMPSTSSYVYQYGIMYDDQTKKTKILYDAAHRIYASNSTGTFSVSWPNSRRLLGSFEENSDASPIGSHLHTLMYQNKLLLDQYKTLERNALLLLLFVLLIGVIYFLYVLVVRMSKNTPETTSSQYENKSPYSVAIL